MSEQRKRSENTRFFVTVRLSNLGIELETSLSCNFADVITVH